LGDGWKDKQGLRDSSQRDRHKMEFSTLAAASPGVLSPTYVGEAPSEVVEIQTLICHIGRSL